MVCPCGLLTLQKKPVPLKSISVTVSILEFVADVEAVLYYENEEKVPVEAFFVFPLDEDSAVYSFEAVADGKRIVAELCDKTTAHDKYTTALSQGHEAFLLESDDLSGDVFSCSVGNLPPTSKVALTLKYVQELALEPDGALRYVLPTILNPRYQLSGSPDSRCLSSQPPLVALKTLPYTLSLTASVSSQRAIDRIQSNCALGPIKYPGDDTTYAEVSLADEYKFDRDVELLIYYQGVHTPNVTVELGDLKSKPDSLMGAPAAMVTFYPNIPETQAPTTCGEFVFLMDRSGSMDCPMNKKTTQTRIEAAKETLILLLKSLPLGCYFNIYGFGSTCEAFFTNSVEYTQNTMEEALKRVKLLKADLGGTEILNPLQLIYGKPSIPGHTLQLFVFTDGEVDNTFGIIEEVRKNSLKHRCFSFGIGEGASTSLIKGVARASGGTAEFITGRDRMQSKVLRALKRSLQPMVEDISLNWNLLPGLSAKVLSPERTSIFQGQRLIIYAQLLGTLLPGKAIGEVCFKYKYQGKNFENKLTFPLQIQLDSGLTVHRLAAKSFIQTKDMGILETAAEDVKVIVQISLESGVISSHTAFIAINKDLKQPVKGSPAHRDIPRPMLLGKTQAFPQKLRMCSPVCSPMRRMRGTKIKLEASLSEACLPLVSREDHLLQLISLQRADGSWEMDEGLATVLGVSLPDMETALPIKDADSSSWATVLAVTWLHKNGQDRKCEWELLERKAVAWIHHHAGSFLQALIEAATTFLKASVDPAIFAL